jgi:peroxiredoxin
MPPPLIGQQAPDFALPEYNSSTTHRLSDLARRAPSMIAFFKRSCQTSRLTLPFVERLHQHYPALQVLGISQDDVEDTSAFVQQTGLTFPVVRDGDWKVSTAYDLFTVPSVFFIETGGAVRRVNMGWNKEQYLSLSDEIAHVLNASAVPLLVETDKVPVFKPG